MTRDVAKPWYREPWPWIVMSGPAIVVVAGIYTAFLAFSTSDTLVAKDLPPVQRSDATRPHP